MLASIKKLFIKEEVREEKFSSHFNNLYENKLFIGRIGSNKSFGAVVAGLEFLRDGGLVFVHDPNGMSSGMKRHLYGERVIDLSSLTHNDFFNFAKLWVENNYSSDLDRLIGNVSVKTAFVIEEYHSANIDKEKVSKIIKEANNNDCYFYCCSNDYKIKEYHNSSLFNWNIFKVSTITNSNLMNFIRHPQLEEKGSFFSQRDFQFSRLNENFLKSQDFLNDLKLEKEVIYKINSFLG